MYKSLYLRIHTQEAQRKLRYQALSQSVNHHNSDRNETATGIHTSCHTVCAAKPFHVPCVYVKQSKHKPLRNMHSHLLWEVIKHNNSNVSIKYISPMSTHILFNCCLINSTHMNCFYLGDQRESHTHTVRRFTCQFQAPIAMGTAGGIKWRIPMTDSLIMEHG